MTGFLRFFRRFPQINVGGDSAHFPPLEDAPESLALLARKRVDRDRGEPSTNDYANQVIPAQVGLAKRPLNVVDPYGLLNVILFLLPSRGINQVINREPSYVNNDVGLGPNVVGHIGYQSLRTTTMPLIDPELLVEAMKKYFSI